MVQVAAIGGKNAHITAGQAEAVNHIDYSFNLSYEVLAICFIGFFLLVLSCAGFFICRCCPAWLPERIRDLRGHIYQTNQNQRKFPLRQQLTDEEYFFQSSFSHHRQNSGRNPVGAHCYAEPVTVPVPDNLILTSSSLSERIEEALL